MMLSEKITLAALMERMEALRSGFESLGGAERQERFLSLFQYLQENEGNFDEEAAPYAQATIEVAIENLQAAVEQAPDSPGHRRLRRQIAVARREHFLVANELRTLESSPGSGAPLQEDAENKCLEILQMVADAFFDSSIRGPISGTHAYAVRALITESMNDMIAGLHLVKHGFVKQAAILVRSVYECHQLMRLFHEQPKWVDLWIDGPGAKSWRELSPSAVRQKLGEGKRDALYEMLSDMAHTSFQATRQKAGMTQDETRPRVTFFVGGIAFQDSVIMMYWELLYVCALLLLRTHAVLKDQLNGEEIHDSIERAFSMNLNFIQDHVLPWARESGLDIVALEKWASIQAGLRGKR